MFSVLRLDLNLTEHVLDELEYQLHLGPPHPTKVPGFHNALM